MDRGKTHVVVGPQRQNDLVAVPEHRLIGVEVGLFCYIVFKDGRG